MVDEMNLAGELDGAETESNWDFDGFGVSSGTEVGHFDHYYLASYREYVGYDRMLEIGPYNFGFRDSPETQNLLEHYPYQNGLLINYWDTSQIDNNVSVHPGEGLILPIDAHPEVMYRADGQPWSNRIQSYDSCFSQSRTDRIKLHWMGERSRHRSQRGVPLFDDSIQYWNAAIPTAGVKNPNTGTTIEIIREKPRTLVIRVNPKH
jgi:immune inhibitor A